MSNPEGPITADNPIVEDGIAKTNEPVSSAVAEPAASEQITPPSSRK